MNLKCSVGFHDWKKDCEKCSVCGKTRNGCHKWTGCTCSACGGIRDEDHEWNGCKCSKCDKTRSEGHMWDGCKCSQCGKTRSEGHVWDGCESSKCGKTRNEGHQWKDWNGYKCSKCREVKSLHGKTVIASAFSLQEPLRAASADDRSFFCVSLDRYGGYEGFWLIDGTKGTTSAFSIETVLSKTPDWVITKYPRIASISC